MTQECIETHDPGTNILRRPSHSGGREPLSLFRILRVDLMKQLLWNSTLDSWHGL